MKKIFAICLIGLAVVGCVSSSYTLSSSTVESNVNAKYRVREQSLAEAARNEGVYDTLFSKDSEHRVMPLQVSWSEVINERENDILSTFLGIFTLGIYPFHTSITALYDVTVTGPQGYGYHSGEFEVVKDDRTGWFASIFAIGSDAHIFWDDDSFKYKPGDLVEIGIARKTLELANLFDYGAYVAEQKKERINEISVARDETMLTCVVQSEDDIDIRFAAEQRLKEITEKTALEQRHRDEVKAEVATFENNQEWDSIIVLCNNEIRNADFIDAGELKEIKATAERSKELKRLSELKALIAEKTKEEKWDEVISICDKELMADPNNDYIDDSVQKEMRAIAVRSKELKRIATIKARIAEKSKDEDFDEIIAICDKELWAAPSRPGHNVEDLEFWKTTRDAAMQSIKSQLDHLLNIGQWKVVLERCEKGLSNKDGVAVEVFSDIKARAVESQQKTIAEREAKREAIIERVNNKFANLNVVEFNAAVKKIENEYGTNSIEYTEAGIYMISRYTLPLWEGIAVADTEFKRRLQYFGYHVGRVSYSDYHDGKGERLTLLELWHEVTYQHGTMSASYGSDWFTYPSWMSYADAKIIWDHYNDNMYREAHSEVNRFKSELDSYLERYIEFEKIDRMNDGNL